MNNNIDLIAFGTFGIPNGFRQTVFSGNKNSTNIKTFDLNTNAIKVFPNAKLYSIRKEYANGSQLIAYTVYSFAKEKNSDRGGTFIGSSIVCHNSIPSEKATVDFLEEFHKALITNKNNVDNHIIQVNHSDHFTLPKNLKGLDKITSGLKAITEINFSATHKNLLVYGLIKPELFEKSLELLNVYDTIFITKSEDVAKFVYEKQLIKLASNQNEFEKEVHEYRNQKELERKKKLQQAIDKVQWDINQFDQSRNDYISRTHDTIEAKKKVWEENKLQLKKLDDQHNKEKADIDHFISQSDDIRALINQHKTHLDSALQALKTEADH